MAVQTDVYNIALGHLGVKPVSLPNENTIQAITLSRFWANRRRSTLSQTNWGFAKVIGALLEVASYTPPMNWLFGYAYPVKAVAVWKVYNPALISDPLLIQDPVINPIAPPMQNIQSYLRLGEPFERVFDPTLNASIILSNCQDALGEYTYDLEDVSQWTDDFVSTMGFGLAAESAVLLTGDFDLAEKMAKAYNNSCSEAQRLNKAEDTSEKFGNGSIVNSRD